MSDEIQVLNYALVTASGNGTTFQSQPGTAVLSLDVLGGISGVSPSLTVTLSSNGSVIATVGPCDGLEDPHFRAEAFTDGTGLQVAWVVAGTGAMFPYTNIAVSVLS